MSKDLFPVSTVNLIKAICAIIIVIHHTSYYLPDNVFTMIFKPVGFLPVGMFLFISGYGLMYSLYKKESYLDTFLKKRLSTILIPPLIGLLFYIVAIHSPVSLDDFFHGKLPFSHYWYIVVILVLYLVFYVTFNITKKKGLGLAVIWILSILYVGLAGIKGIDSYWYYTIWAFPVGLSIAYIEKSDNANKLHKWIYDSRKLLLSFCTILFVCSTAIKYGNIYMPDIIPTHLMSILEKPGVLILLTLLSSSSLPIIIYLLNIQVLKTATVSFLAGISYELYIIHNLIVYEYNMIFGIKDFFSLTVIVMASIIAAYILKKIDKSIFSILHFS